MFFFFCRLFVLGLTPFCVVLFLPSACATNVPYLKNVTSLRLIPFLSWCGSAAQLLTTEQLPQKPEPRSCGCAVFSVGLGSTLTAEAMGEGQGKVTGRVFFFRRKTSEKVSEA